MTKTLVSTYLLFSFVTLFCGLSAHGEAADSALAKVTIVVDGMMKSKSGAT